MAEWSERELRALGSAYEIRVAGRRKDGSIRTLTPVWHVVVAGAPYIRSMYGAEGQWYKGIVHHFEGAIEWDGTVHEVTFVRDGAHDDDIDTALYAKYGTGSATHGITNATARSTTLRIEPR